jgi:hypothetical protein
MGGAVPPLPHYAFMREHWGNFTLPLPFYLNHMRLCNVDRKGNMNGIYLEIPKKNMKFFIQDSR